MSEPVPVSTVIADIFARGALPERVAGMVPHAKAGVRVGDVLTWADDRRAYVTPRGDFCVLAQYVRFEWLRSFCWAPPAQMELCA